jgi:hypothetical protein
MPKRRKLLFRIEARPSKGVQMTLTGYEGEVDPAVVPAADRLAEEVKALMVAFLNRDSKPTAP